MEYLAQVRVIIFHIFILICVFILTCLAQSIPQSYLDGLPFSMPEVQLPTFPARTISIVDYGAVPDGQTLNTKAFKDAIQTCAKAGGGTVIVPSGVWLTGPIEFESNINLYLENGAIIMFSKNRDDFALMPYPTPNSKNYQCANPIYGYGLENIAITGKGIIDGSGEVWRPKKKEKYTVNQWKKIVESGGAVTEDGKMWWPSDQAMKGEGYLKNLRKEKKDLTKEDFLGVKDFLRSHMVVFYSCKKVLFDGPTFRNSPKFCVNPIQCEQVVIRNIVVQNEWNAQNGDGIDIGSSHNVFVYNCIVDVGDDDICLKPGNVDKERGWSVACENIVIADCIVYRGHGGFVIGSETYGGTRNVSVRNCTFIGTDIGLRFKSSRTRGGKTENIYIDGIQMKDIVNEAILFDMYYEEGKPEQGSMREKMPITERTPLFQKFHINNVVCNGASHAIFIRGLPEQFVNGIEFTDITISAKRGVIGVDAEQLQFKNVRLIVDEGPIFDFDNMKDITIQRPGFQSSITPFLKVSGKESMEIYLLDTKLSGISQQIERGSEVRSDAVIFK